MTVIAFVFLFGLFDGGPSTFPEKHLIRITDEADLPDMERTRPIAARPGWRAGLYHEARFGWRPGKCDAIGGQVVDRLKAALGDPLRIERRGEVRFGYMWRWHDEPAKGLLIVVNASPPSAHLKGWHLRDEAPNGRLDREVENQVYRWFDDVIGR